MDAYSVVQRLLPGVDLTPGQLAQLRAIDIKYQTALYALKQRAKATDRNEAASGESEMTELHARIVADVRAMLTVDQQRTFQQNLALLEGMR